jgi:hypothetical protein
MAPNRRQYLVGLAASGALALAGCSSGGGGDEPEEEPETDPSDEVYDGLRIDGEVMSPSFPMEFYEVGSGERVAQIHWHGEGGEWHQAPLEIPLDGQVQTEIRILDPDLEQIPAGAGTKFQFEIEPTDETPEGLFSVEVSDAIATFRGLAEGEGDMTVYILADGERIWSSPPLAVVVGTPE